MRRLAVALLVVIHTPLVVEAQLIGTVPRIGLLDVERTNRAPLWEAFRQGMRELGYVEGRTVVFEARIADGHYERLLALATELVHLRVDVIVTATVAVRAARQATATIPIVMASGDPLATGVVADIARPGGNVTGVTTLSVELSAKRLDLARELVPGTSRLALIWSVGSVGPDPGERIVGDTEAAARVLGANLHVVGVRGPGEIDPAFSTIARERPAVLLVAPSPLFFGQRRRLAELAVKHRLPTVFAQREFAEAGGLIAYGTNLAERFRRAAVYVDKILKGARPADLPVEQPTKFELVINLKTAKTLGLTIPQSVLARADEVIQ
jgi:putative ABC transport system substrate-binding protein